MGKTTNETSYHEEDYKQRRKQARHEAKLMLALEQVKTSISSAQEKIARTQAKLAARQAKQQRLEAKLAGLRPTPTIKDIAEDHKTDNDRSSATDPQTRLEVESVDIHRDIP